MSNHWENTSEYSIESIRVGHHIFDHKHCQEILKPLYPQINEGISKALSNAEKLLPTVIPNNACLSSMTDFSTSSLKMIGRGVCSCDEEIAKALARFFSETAAKNVQAVVKLTGPLSVAIGASFIVVDIAHAPPEKKLERAGRGTAKLALTTGAGVLGTFLLGPVGTLSFSIAASLLGEALDPK